MQTQATEFTICNSMLVEIPYSTVLQAIEDTDSDPFTMSIRCQAEWSAIALCVNQGIDAYLEAAIWMDSTTTTTATARSHHIRCVCCSEDLATRTSVTRTSTAPTRFGMQLHRCKAAF